MPNRELEGLYAEFHLHPVLQAEQSRNEGREIYKDEVYIKIQIKGQKNQIRDRKMKPEDKTDFPNAWEIWTNKEQASKVGTPITAIPGVGPSLELELKILGVHTVEDLAALTDAGCQNIRGGYMFRQRAIAYLAAVAIKPEPVKEPAQPMEAPVDTETLKNMPGVVQRTDAPRRRGRPPKAKAVA